MVRPKLVTGLSQRAQQQMLLQPRLLQSIAVLQLSNLELKEHLSDALLTNDALRVSEPSAPEPSDPTSSRAPRTARTATSSSTDAPDWAALTAGPGPSLADELCGELALRDLPATLERWARLLVSCLDSHGWLSSSDDELLELARAEGLEPDHALLGRAIGVLQSLEPRGVGARDATEALLLQLDPKSPDYALLCRLIEEFLDQVSRNKLPAVARELGVELPRLAELLLELRALAPSPLQNQDERSAQHIVPEIVVERGASGFVVRVESADLPTLALDDDALRRARDAAPQLRQKRREDIEAARWLIEAVESRRATLLLVASRVFEHQREFLEHGPGHLAPLGMQAIADELGLAVSTISRTVAGKHVDTPFGVFALRHFFQASAGGGEEHARDDVRELLRAVFVAEDSRTPLSDDEVVEHLRAQGRVLARRTVAKYRGELGIKSSYQRRRFV